MPILRRRRPKCGFFSADAELRAKFEQRRRLSEQTRPRSYGADAGLDFSEWQLRGCMGVPVFGFHGDIEVADCDRATNITAAGA